MALPKLRGFSDDFSLATPPMSGPSRRHLSPGPPTWTACLTHHFEYNTNSPPSQILLQAENSRHYFFVEWGVGTVGSAVTSAGQATDL
ncbi:hypothetical protein J6590_051882 [Homalodisca vitripennis]|nr:hypothetical protein J6590_051882 [Homalodisca vitripennis]